MSYPIIEFENIEFAYPSSRFRLDVPSLVVQEGEKVALVGSSGIGKTTLLHLAAGILLPQRGTVRIDGTPLSQQTDRTRREFRIRNLGMIFQEFELLEYITVRDNILLPYCLNNSLKLDRSVRDRAAMLAEAVDIGSALRRRPGRLSQGERQRVAISRALITQPRTILADEPTGNLDPGTSQTIVDLLLEQADARRATVLMVTHDHTLLDRFDRVVDLGQLLVENSRGERP
jgi:putative ABC transport system ATP-binding protein